jgi:hypothetical protein
VTPAQRALELFDSLEPVDIDFMIGTWRGEGYPTGHAQDGLLEAYQWYGKAFESSEDVHPLLFSNRRGKIVKINPGVMALGGQQVGPASRIAVRVFQFIMPMLRTSKSRARLRMTEYRGKVSATMIYDQLPINDIFRKLDEDTVLGVMDHKFENEPFFFKLTRENSVSVDERD